MELGSTKWYGVSVEAIRVPGGIVYKAFEDRPEMINKYNDAGVYISENRPAVSVSVTFAPFPPGLYEKLLQL